MISRKDIELRYSDTDQMGVIYHANYLTFFMQGRTKFLQDLGYEYLDFEKNGYMFTVRDASCTYLKSIRLDEEVYVETSIDKMSKVKATYYHEIKNKDGELKATGYTTVVSVNIKTLRPERWDDKFPEIYQAYMNVIKKTK